MAENYHRALNSDVANALHSIQSGSNMKNGLEEMGVEISRLIQPVFIGIKRNGLI